LPRADSLEPQEYSGDAHDDSGPLGTTGGLPPQRHPGPLAEGAPTRDRREGVTVRQLATTGVWIATSGTDAGTAYVVTPTDCECRAAQEGDVCCKHRALLRHVRGLLTLDPDPTPAAPAIAEPPRSAVVEVLDATGRLVYRSDDLAAERAA